jgi:hypothetical protein
MMVRKGAATRSAQPVQRPWVVFIFSAAVVTISTSAGCGSSDDGGASGLNDVDVPKVYAAVKADLARQGTPVDRTFWDDPDKFQLLMNAFTEEITRETGKAPESGSGGLVNTAALSVHVQDGPIVNGQGSLVKTEWCGPGHGPASVKNPPVTDCVNKACEAHDQCYDRCTGTRAGLVGQAGCSFTDATRVCDNRLFGAINGCPREWSWNGLWSEVIHVIAEGLAVLPNNSFCGADFTCHG